MLLGGAELHVHTDYKNPTSANFEENAPTFHYVKNSDNVLATFLSWVPTMVEQRVVERPNDSVAVVLTDDINAHFVLLLDDLLSCFDCFQSSTKALESFTYFPTDMIQNPIASVVRIAQFFLVRAKLASSISMNADWRRDGIEKNAWAHDILLFLPLAKYGKDNYLADMAIVKNEQKEV